MPVEAVSQMTLAGKWKKLLSANGTTAGTSFTPTAPTATRPSGSGVIDFGEQRAVPNNLLLQFIGTSAADQTLIAYLETFNQTASGLWIPVPMFLALATLGTSVGVAGHDAVATDFFADTIVLSSSYTSQVEAISPANNGVGMIAVDIKGSILLKLSMLRNSSAASYNAFWKTF